MTLNPGTRLGPYEIVAPLGVGGMGEVYRATDTNLKRQVAIKVLPAAVAADADRLARFQREAEILAALNHPNIAHIHGLERTDGNVALVMELVEGPTLADRISQGPMSLDEALPIARQIAEALEAAHEQGIIHRDLKPANIKVREDGAVKVLDFGLAKASEPAGALSGRLSMSPTITTPAMTLAGIILGTAAYMSPEQARGRTVDKRSDVWAFGCLLFEMLSGSRAFDGEDVAETLGAVIHKDPLWVKLPAEMPAVVRTVLQRCLQKDPKQRFRDIGDVQLALNGAFESSLFAPAAAVAPQKAGVWRVVLIALASACLAAVVAASAAWGLKPPAPLPVTRSRFVLPEGLQFTIGGRQWVDVSPDGMQLVYSASGALFLRSLSELEGRNLIGDGPTRLGVSSPAFSPDGRAVAYFEGTTLKRLATSGGSPITLGECDPPWGVSWSEAGILVGQGPKGILRITDRDGAPEQIVRVGSTEVAAHPRMLAGTKVVLFSLASTQTPGSDLWEKARIVAQRIDTGERKTIVEGGSNPRYLSTGHIVYAVAGTLFAAPFDPRRLVVTGAAVQVQQNVRRVQSTTQPAGVSQYAISEGGTLAFIPGSSGLEARRIVSMNRRGGMTPLALPPNAYVSLRVSPDGQRLAFDTDDGQDAIIWIYDLSGASQPRRLTFGGRNRFPVWSADSRRVLFQSDRDGSLGLYWQAADSGGAERLTTPEPGTAHVPESWSPTEDRFSFSVVRGTSVTLWTFSMRDKQASRFGTAQSTSSFNSEFSPDGRWLAYTLRPGTSANIFVEPFPATGDQHQITTTNGHHPVWLPGGKTLSYRVGASEQVLVDVSTTSGFSVSHPTSATVDALPINTGARSFDITRDGSAFITLAPVSANGPGTTSVQEIRIVQNWTEDLKRLVPTK